MGDPVIALLERLARPYDAVRVLESLGVPHRAARQVAGSALATSPEADRLLDTMPRTVRALAVATTDTPQRCVGEIRGPVLWSETVSTRAASAGDPGIFVCTSPARAFDTDENRVLVAALAAVLAAADDASEAAEQLTDDVVRHARHNAQRALRYLEHRCLAELPRRRPHARALRRTRAGSRRGTYAPALALLGRAGSPLRSADVAGLVDDDRLAALDLFVRVLSRAAHEALRLPAPRVRHGGLEAGPMRCDPGGTASASHVAIGGTRVASVEAALTALGE